ncbi:hypothetical protein JOL79_29995 [Microbispora sp. RL4-1S]|uniref:Tyrosine-type recombinase/integrase n=1 Tax=Microbispora oryzae TaxID=2806554 RepID=A0A940WLV1_9ACTN|nr:hypothetical protein [Microbispora oryzae]MBP2708020.1 hypothetical protein [Microbispora oryzae]
MGHCGGQHLERPSVLSRLGWCESYGYEGPAVPAWTKPLTVPDSKTPACLKMGADRLIARREVYLREKTLWRMLYETAGRAEEILGVNIEALDLAARGPETGWDVHEYRHSALTHLGEQGASLLMLMAKSRHKKPENVRR